MTETTRGTIQTGLRNPKRRRECKHGGTGRSIAIVRILGVSLACFGKTAGTLKLTRQWGLNLMPSEIPTTATVVTRLREIQSPALHIRFEAANELERLYALTELYESYILELETKIKNGKSALGV